MNSLRLRVAPLRQMLPTRRFPLFVLAFALLAVAPAADAAGQLTEAKAANTADDGADNEDIVSLAAYNVKADRIEDFGLRVESAPYPKRAKSAVGFFLSKFAPIITAIVPNTAAARSGLQPGERILKSEDQSTVGGLFSGGKFGSWSKSQKKKWAEVAAGKKNVTWTLEVESPATKSVRTVKLVVPTPPPHWGASVWRKPKGRIPSTVAEPGPLAECSRAVLDNGIWTLVHDGFFQDLMGAGASLSSEPTGYEWRIGSGPEGEHRIFVTQFRGRTDVVLEAGSGATGRWVYLTSPSGVLERAWRWHRYGKRSGAVTLEGARAGFANELDFWTSKVAKVSPRWPFEVIPGYDANAVFAVLAGKDGAAPIAVVRHLSREFQKLALATPAQQALFSDAYAKLGAESDHWAYTETSHGVEDQRMTVTRVDPSKPEAERCVLLSIDGKAPTPDEVRRWRDDGGDVPKPLGELPPLMTIVDIKDLRILKEETAAVVFELPTRGGNADFPAEKFQALFQVNKTSSAFERITVRLRESLRVAGVVNITDAGLEVRFETINPALAPQPVWLRVGGGARVLLVKFSRSFEATRTDFEHVEPFEEAVAEAK